MPYKVKLTKVSTNKNGMRTPIVEGYCDELPTVGQGFILLTEPLETGDVRKVWTSNVKAFSVEEPKEMQFTTQYSEYRLEIQAEVEQNPYELPPPIMVQIDEKDLH
jgi:hypothetical protein